ncbi:lipase [Streptomyces sp. ME19-01-6]|uniref:alpha/beta hydrolase family protein n=1 Tax=Streptomyces sp. ME19-01-6 TaxID=3028686 RepID=UPI0029B16001|nr:lipase [Streptomyces sp. ME19-01-6]MDX3225906.1 lipase [Streptomyces sp. ME19-01-6]
MRNSPRRTGSRRTRTGARTGTRVAALCAALLLAGSAAPALAAAPGGTTAGATGVAADAASRSGRGTLVSFDLLYTLEKPDDVTTWLTSAKFDTGTVRYGVDAYQLVYRTVDPYGRPTTASGLLVLPRGREGRLRPVSFAHGTGSHKNDSPSMQTGGFLPAPPITYASAGHAAVAPDYLGMGLGPGPHPWMDVPSETTASLDLLRAARAFAPRTGRTLDREVAVTGFSQGASAALGLARALQSGEDRWFRLGALAPVSGAYDFGGAELPALLAGELEPKSSVLYAAYTLVAFNRLHHLYDSPAEVFQAPYADTIEALFDGAHTGRQLMEGTPATLDKLLTAHGRDLLGHPTGPMAAALRTTDDVCDWAPRVPVRLYMASGDEQATVANTAHCEAVLRRHGVAAPVVDLGAVDYNGSRHLGSNVRATAAIVRWLDSLR